MSLLRRVVLAVAAVVFTSSLMACCCCLPIPNTNPPAAPAVQPDDVPAAPVAKGSIRKGAAVVIDCPGEDEALVSRDFQTHDDLIAASNRKNADALGRLISAGRVYVIPKGTPAIVTDVHLLSVEVEITGGGHAGKRGVVVREWVKPAD